MRSTTSLYLGLVFLTGLNLFNYLDRFVLASLVPPIKSELQLSDGQIGWLTSTFMIGYFATAPLFGYLGDRWRRKPLIGFGVAVWSLGTILSGFSHQYSTLLACRLLVGLGEASYSVLAPAWLADLFPAEKRNNALTIFYAAIPLGSALGYLLGGFAVEHGGWRIGFLWAGAPGLLLVLALQFLREPFRESAGLPGAAVSTSVAKPGLTAYLRLFRIGDFTLVLLGNTAYAFALGAFGAWGPTFLNRVNGLDLSAADHFFGGVLAVAGLFGTLIGGFAATAWRRKARAGYALLLTASVAVAVPFVILALIEGGTTASTASLAAAMFLLFLPMGPITTLLLESVPTALRASAMAASIFVIHMFGDFWSPAIVGLVSDWSHNATMPQAGLQRAMFILPAVLGLSIVFWGLLAWRQQRRPVGTRAGESEALVS